MKSAPNERKRGTVKRLHEKQNDRLSDSQRRLSVSYLCLGPIEIFADGQFLGKIAFMISEMFAHLASGADELLFISPATPQEIDDREKLRVLVLVDPHCAAITALAPSFGHEASSAYFRQFSHLVESADIFRSAFLASALPASRPAVRLVHQDRD